METTFKKALSQIKADDKLKIKTAQYILNLDSNVISIQSASATKKKTPFAKKLIAAACIAAVFCALPVGAYAYYKTPTSYISVDINPSVELGINSFGKVVSVTAYNTDGETVVAGLSLINSDVESAVKLIVISASQNGFIKDDGSSFISVTAETNNENRAEKLKQNAQAGAEDAIESEDDTATIEADNIALDRRDEAIALGITPGKLNLIQKLQALDPDILTDEFKNASVSDIQKKFTELKKEHSDQNAKDDAEEMTSPSPSASPSPTPPSATPSDNKPNNHSNGNNNGNGVNKHDDPISSPTSTNDQNSDVDYQNVNDNRDKNNENQGNDHSRNS